MLSQGPLTAGTVAEDTTVGTIALVNVINSQGAADAVFTKASSHAIAITAVADNNVKTVKGGTIGGSNLAGLTNLSTILTWVSYGGSANLWGQTWLPSDINASTFGVAFAIQFTKATPLISHYWKATNFGFSIPPNSIISGILVEVDNKYDSVSFADGSMISMPFGKIPIELVKIGDIIYAFDKSGDRVIDEVTDISRRLATEGTVLLTTKTHQVNATKNHKLRTKRGWVKAEELTVNDFMFMEDGKWEKLEEIRFTEEEVWVNSISLKKYHTYFANGFAVHNVASTTTWTAYVDAFRITVYYNRIPKGIVTYQQPGVF